jgi:hypothetical protein
VYSSHQSTIEAHSDTIALAQEQIKKTENEIKTIASLKDQWA